jgi:hypothetical protein
MVVAGEPAALARWRESPFTVLAEGFSGSERFSTLERENLSEPEMFTVNQEVAVSYGVQATIVT